MKKTYWVMAVGIGTAVGLVVAATATFMDWRLNPGGIFHGAEGTNWSFVWQTATSWFVPVAAAATVVAVLALYIISRPH